MAEKTYKDERGEFIFRRKNGKIIKIYIKGSEQAEEPNVVKITSDTFEPELKTKTLEGDHSGFDNERFKKEFGIEPVKMTFAEADTGNVNPNYGFPGYDINCQTCVVAFEYRMRGFDIHAHAKDTHPLSPQSKLAKNGLKFWKKKNGEVPTNLLYDEQLDSNEIDKKIVDTLNGYGRNGELQKGLKEMRSKYGYSAKKLLKKMQEVVEPGARYFFDYPWSLGSAHIVCVMKDDDEKLFIYDPQSDRTFRESELLNYFDRIAFTRKEVRYSWTNRSGRTSFTFPMGLGLYRVDDAEFDPGDGVSLANFFYHKED